PGPGRARSGEHHGDLHRGLGRVPQPAAAPEAGRPAPRPLGGGRTMIKKMGCRWHLRTLMAGKGMFQTSELVPLLAERGVHLSRGEVFRPAPRPPQRLSMDPLAALCDILGCPPNDLIEVEVVNATVRKAAGEDAGPAPAVRRTSIRKPPGL